MAFVLFRGKLYHLPTGPRAIKTRIGGFQETYQDCEVLIYVPEEEHDLVPLLELQYPGEAGEGLPS